MSEAKKPIMRSLGEFVGHVWKGLTADVEPDRREVRRVVEEEERETERGRVTLRRTTIEEVEFEGGGEGDRASGGGRGAGDAG